MDRRRRDQDEPGGWRTAAGIAVGVTAAAVGIGAIIGALSSLSTETEEQPHSSYTVQEASSEDEDEADTALTYNTGYQSSQWAVVHRGPTVDPQGVTSKIRNIHALLEDIHVHHVALKDEEFEEHYRVFHTIFGRIHEMMKEVDPYYKRNSSNIQFAGSHYDGLRINKPDEIDLDIAIRLPVSMRARPAPEQSDVVLENRAPGCVLLRMGAHFQNLPFREDFHINKTAYRWMDDKKYLLRFLAWFQSVVVRALNCFGRNERGEHFSPVDNVYHTIRISGSGPAVTLIIENEDGFQLNVDLVPALKFPEERWPICRGYRGIPPNCEKEYFMVVPKENKALISKTDKDRAWRLALHLQERELMHNTNRLRQTIRFIKKFRDSQNMGHIKSYFIKTLFYLEVVQLPDAAYWNNNSATLLAHMAKRLEQALRTGTIPYFWNEDSDLLWDVNRSTLTGYANKLREFIRVLESPWEYKEAARYLLTDREYEMYKWKLE